MTETLRRFDGETGSKNPGRERLNQQLRALEFYISGMNNHPVDMPWASLNKKTGQLEITGDREGCEPPIRLAVRPTHRLARRFIRGDRNVTFNPQKRILEAHH